MGIQGAGIRVTSLRPVQGPVPAEAMDDTDCECNCLTVGWLQVEKGQKDIYSGWQRL